MKTDLAIAALIRSRMAELGLSRGEFGSALATKTLRKGYAGSMPCATATSKERNNFWTCCRKPWKHPRKR